MNKTSLQLVLIFLLLIAADACIVIETQYQALPPGIWRGILRIEPQAISPNPKGKPLPDKVNMTYEMVTPGEIPFNFDVIYDNDSTFHIELINGEERITIPSEHIHFGRSRERARDTIRIEFPVFDSYITGAFAGDIIEGTWVVKNRENYAIPFIADQGKNYRFTPLRKDPATDLTGRWEATFGLQEDDPYPAIAEFTQSGNRLTGTFMTETGDYRYLEGTVQEDKFWLSVFDGSHAFLFEGKILSDNELTGAFYSGKHYKTTWNAVRNENAALRAPDSLTFLQPGYDKLDFSFENPDGEVISPDHSAYEGKVKIIQIMGTWCPNCRDASHFLKDYLRDHPGQEVAVIALAFEKYRNKDTANKAIRTYREKMDLPYEIVHAGYYNKEEAQKALPMLNRVLAYPTLIVLDRQNRVKLIHTGFNGPATSEYEAFRKNFENFMEDLLKD